MNPAKLAALGVREATRLGWQDHNEEELDYAIKAVKKAYAPLMDAIKILVKQGVSDMIYDVRARIRYDFDGGAVRR